MSDTLTMREALRLDIADLRTQRDAAQKVLTLIADDCEAWLRSESDEPSAEFIKLVAQYARNHLTQ